ncbi:hypothetical protein FT663_00875 [Candidozyma haemuli var. vulneris]|uniref:SANT domain-containing protein n=1 Tax=Candidozyma haemuli TaxID=45357 RepID=A0A2V1AVW9_9ASCO|nr:hypothetical protein CXQ85_004640 [[Candida] haemuloni]KAF3990939.1 hypothetical protein FT662_01996 [[Candida] haemuloni var. vulneris]KAF3995039.1 hypothetical protein FT663_00875 [[Candida] haemuloni var. vulneris]PVH21975.1 hypothetical protein CXQ85_004640 [[Candida] haemuloni]
MSSGSRGGPPIGRDRDRDVRYGSGSDDYGKRRKNFYSGSTRRDFKSTNSPPGLDNSPSQGSYPPRSDKPPANDYGRSRYRGSSLSNSGPSYGGARSSLYGKDSRYSGSKPSYGYNSKYYSDRSSGGAYGSYNASKRDPNSEYYGYSSSGRDFRERDPRDSRDIRDSREHREVWDYKDSTSRDMINNSNIPRESGRDSWRSDRPKTSLSASGPSGRAYGSSRFNSNNIPVAGRSAGQGSGSLSNSGPDYKRERYDYDNDDSYGGRWKSSYGPRDKSRSSLSGSRPYNNKEKRSAGLTNSLSGKRSDSYYPSRSPAYSSSGSRYQERYTDRYSERRNDFDDAKSDYNGSVDDYNDVEEDGSDYGERSRYRREDSREPDERYPEDDEDEDEEQDDEEDVGDVTTKTHEEDSDKETESKTTDEIEKDAELEAKKISESVVHDLKTIEANERNEHPTGSQVETQRPETQDEDYSPRDKIASAEPEANDVKIKDEAIPANVGYVHPKPALEEKPAVDPSTIRSIESLKSVKVSSEELDTIDYPEGCFAPLTELDTKLQTLKIEFAVAKEQNHDESFLRFTLAKPLTNLQDYPFFEQNLAQFASKFQRIKDIFNRRDRDVKKKRLALWIRYNTLEKENDKRRKKLEEQLKIIHPPDDDFRKELESIDIRPKNNDTVPDAQSPTEPQPQPGRRGRRHGDLVTTEAEFQEILKSLENEQNEDPLSKAQRVSATIPDLILDPIERQSFIFMDSNNIVHDKETWASRVKTDFMDNFTEKEHDAFCEAFCRAPKRFGEISRIIGGLRTAEECVVHYYMTKKAVNYKYLVSQFKKRSARKPSRRKAKLKEQEASSSTATDTAPVEATDSGRDTESGLTPDIGGPTLELAEEVRRKRGVEAVDYAERTTTEEGIEAPPKKKTRRRREEEVHLPSTDSSQPDVHGQMSTDGSSQLPPGLSSPSADRSANGSLSDDKRKAITSYWSITEVNDFPRMLASFGSKWSLIAQKLNTKTATMVRNYYQRNAEKNGWQQIVLDADGRLGQGVGDPHSHISNVDATIVVRPQRRPEEYGRRPDEQYNGTYETHAPKFSDVPVGTFQHPFPAVPPKRASVGSLLSGPPPVMYEPASQPPHFPGVSSAPSAASQQPVHHTAPVLPAPVSQPAKHGGVKPSIMSLLNADSAASPPPSGPPPQPYNPQPATSAPAPAPAPAPRPGNLASLLNASSSPVRPPETSQSKPEPSAPRKNSIKSLLHDS